MHHHKCAKGKQNENGEREKKKERERERERENRREVFESNELIERCIMAINGTLSLSLSLSHPLFRPIFMQASSSRWTLKKIRMFWVLTERTKLLSMLWQRQLWETRFIGHGIVVWDSGLDEVLWQVSGLKLGRLINRIVF